MTVVCRSFAGSWRRTVWEVFPARSTHVGDVGNTLDPDWSCPDLRPLRNQDGGLGFPSEGKQSLCCWISEETWAPGLMPGSPVGFTSAWPDSDVGRPAGMLVSIHQTNSVASSLFSHNCKQTEAAVARQLPSGLKSHQVHLVWITSLPPRFTKPSSWRYFSNSQLPGKFLCDPRPLFKN